MLALVGRSLFQNNYGKELCFFLKLTHFNLFFAKSL
jgi:hypothetical protein